MSFKVNSKIRFNLRYPAVLVLISFVLLGPLCEHVEVFTQTKWQHFLTSIFYPETPLVACFLLIFLIVFGPTLEKVYGSAKFIFLFVIVGIIGGILFQYIFTYEQPSTAMISLSGILGIYYPLMIKRNHLLSKTNQWLYWLTCLLTLIVLFKFRSLPKAEVVVGVGIGIFLTLFIKPQSFRQLARMRWGPSMAKSLFVISSLMFLMYLPKLMDGTNLVSGISERVNEWIGENNSTVKTEEVRVNIEQRMDESSKGQFSSSTEANKSTKQVVRTGDELYNAILRSLEGMENKVNLKEYTTDSDTAFDTLHNVLADHPEIFYYDYTTSRFWSNGILELGYKYKESDVHMLKGKLEEAKNHILGNVLSGIQNDYEKVKAIHDYLVKHTKYDYDNYLANTIPDESHTIVGALLLQTAVCEGYAKAVQFLLNDVGIESLFVTGMGNGEGHAWNKVKVNGSWYNLDATWNDPVPDRPGKVSYQYFLVTDKHLARDHQWEQVSLPVANSTKYMKLALLDQVF